MTSRRGQALRARTSARAGVCAILIGVFLLGCSTRQHAETPETQTDGGSQLRAAPENGSFVFEIVDAGTLSGLSLRGTDEWPEDRIEFGVDGDLRIAIDGETYAGAWSYDAARLDFPLTLAWVDSTSPDEYVARLARVEIDEYALEARWYYVDPLIRVYRRYVAD